MTTRHRSQWPELRYPDWSETCSTLHRWTQVVGKVRLVLTPWLNHSWHVPLYVTAKGLATSPIAHGDRAFEILFDFRRHTLEVDVSDGASACLPLRPQSVAQFYRELMGVLDALELSVAINAFPCEIPNAVSLDRDEIHAAYDADAARRFFEILVQVDRVFKVFRTSFVGKASPVHFFWGSFDLAVTRFSGRDAPAFQGNVPGLSTEVMREAYSHEVSSAGFWPGGNGIDYPCFYSYQYPVVDEFKRQTVQPKDACYSDQLGEFLLPYDAVRASTDPDATLLAFLQSTYEAAATASNWDRTALERPLGKPLAPNA
jgi:hypothetical protein